MLMEWRNDGTDPANDGVYSCPSIARGVRRCSLRGAGFTRECAVEGNEGGGYRISEARETFRPAGDRGTFGRNVSTSALAHWLIGVNKVPLRLTKGKGDNMKLWQVCNSVDFVSPLKFLQAAREH